ncbi:Gypsy retrotransposon integrase-like protein 1 [Glycine max]|nr:Gypsy retrotransposon integrase-like protein 1 [Glycine max]
MKADLLALKDQMASITEAMLKIQKTIEDNATAAASNTAREAEPVLQPAINLGRDRNVTAYPYGLPPDFTPRTAPDDLSQAPTFEGQLPPHANYSLQEDDEGDAHLGPLLPLKEPAPNELPQPNIVRHVPERIEFGLRKGKFEYASNVAPNKNRRALVVGTRKKEGDTHAVTTAPTWMKTPQNAQNSYQHNHPNFSIRAGSSLPTQVEGPPATEKMPAQHTTPATPRPANNTTPGASYNNARRPPRDEFSLVFQPPYPKWYNSNATCAYHSGAPGHNIDSCLPFMYKVQHLINVGWLSFQEEGPNVKTNPLASHRGATVNAIEKDRPSGSKRLKEVVTSRRFIYQSLQAACMVSRGGGESDECLFHLRESHDMETCPMVEELLQRLMDWGQLEVSEGDREEPQICMWLAERTIPPTPKALECDRLQVHVPPPPLTAPKPTPFSYQSNKVVPWKYTPPAFGERAATEVDSLTAKVTNITGLSGITHSGRVSARPYSAELPSKGKAPMIQEPADVATPSKEVDPPVVKGAEKKEGLQGKAVTLGEAHEFLRLIQQSEFRVVEQLNKTSARISLIELLINSEPHRALLVKVLNEAHDSHENADVVDIRGNPYKYGLGYEPGKLGRKNAPSRFWVDRAWPDHISQCFTSAGIMFEEEVAAIGEESPQDPPSFVRPCHPNSQVGNWRVMSQSELAEFFDDISIHHIPREENQMADALATLASMDLLYIEFRSRGKPAHCCAIEEERDGKPWYFDIKQYVENKEYPPGIFDNDKRTLRRLVTGFFVSGTILYKRNHDMTLLRCVDAKEANYMIEEIHGGSFGTHANGHAMARKILRASYYWLTMESDYYAHVMKFHKCQAYADNVNVPPHPLNVMSSPWPFSMWGIDVIGAIEPKASNGHRFILVAIDYFTKWVEAASCTNVTRSVVVRFIKKDLVLKKISHAVKDNRGKWAPNYEGPFIVKRAFSGGGL